MLIKDMFTIFSGWNIKLASIIEIEADFIRWYNKMNIRIGEDKR